MDANTPIVALKEALRRGRTVLVVGAGVSKSFANLPDWRQAVVSAIDHLARVGTVPSENVAALRARLDAARTPAELIACAARVREALTGASPNSGEFAAWLQAAFGVALPAGADASLLRAIFALPVGLVATTNYDKLLSRYRSDLESVTWREPHLLLQALRHGDRVVHLHGVWDDPDSVVFGETDYGRIADDPAHRGFLQTLWLDRTIVFVGASADGMTDPDFRALLEWAEAAFPHATNRHFALVRGGSYTPEQADEFLNRWRIQLVPYGVRYEDLTPFLDGLAPLAPSLAPPPPRVFAGRDEQVAAIRAAIAAGEPLLVHGMGGIGKTSVVARAVADLSREQPGARLVWIDRSMVSATELGREVGRAIGALDIDAVSDRDVPGRLAFAVAAVQAPTVVVVDDPDDLATVRGFANSVLPTGAALVATCRSRASGFARLLEVGPLDVAAAVEVFGRTAGVPPDAPFVGDICALLEGHPLAIVLAAGRHAAEAMPLERLLDRLAEEKHRLDTLRDPELPETASSSVRAALAVSLDRLSPELENTLSTLSAFSADTSVELLASALCLDVMETEDRVGRLVARSLVQRGHALHLHALVRDAAKERRSDEDWTDLEGTVDRVIVALLTGFDETSAESRRRIITDLDNVLAFILNTRLSDHEGRRFAAIMFAHVLCSPDGLLSHYALFQQRLVAADAILDVALALAEISEHQSLEREVLQSRAEVARRRRDANAALTALMRAQEIATAEGDYNALASIKCAAGNLFIDLYDYRQAELAMRSGLADAIRAEHQVATAQLTGQLGLVLLKSDRLDEARDRYEEAKRLYRDLGMPHGVAACAERLAEVAKRQDREADAWALHRESLAADLEADNLIGAFLSLEQLADTVKTDEQLRFVLQRGDEIAAGLPPATRLANTGFLDRTRATAYVGANRLAEAKEILLRSLDALSEADSRARGIVLGQLSNIAIAEGEFSNAGDYNRRSRLAYAEAQDINGMLTCRYNGISLAVEQGDVDGAIDEGCEAVLGAAMLGDLERVTRTAETIAMLVLPRLDRLPELLEPAEEDDFYRLMGILAGAAQQRDLGRVFGTLGRITSRFGPGGIERDRSGPPEAIRNE